VIDAVTSVVKSIVQSIKMRSTRSHRTDQRRQGGCASAGTVVGVATTVLTANTGSRRRRRTSWGGGGSSGRRGAWRWSRADEGLWRLLPAIQPVRNRTTDVTARRNQTLPGWRNPTCERGRSGRARSRTPACSPTARHRPQTSPKEMRASRTRVPWERNAFTPGCVSWAALPRGPGRHGPTTRLTRAAETPNQRRAAGWLPDPLPDGASVADPPGRGHRSGAAERQLTRGGLSGRKAKSRKRRESMVPA
jgi:hypothetical protein